jgi:hypothetical protein
VIHKGKIHLTRRGKANYIRINITGASSVGIQVDTHWQACGTLPFGLLDATVSPHLHNNVLSNVPWRFDPFRVYAL